jgi:hypothetical protein
MPKVPAFFVHAGVKLNSIALEFTRSGPAAATINAIAQGETRFGTTQGGTPTSLTFSRISQFQGSIKRAGSPVGNLTGGSVTYSNNLEKIETLAGLQWRHRVDRVLRVILDPRHGAAVARRSVRLPAPMEPGACARGERATRHASIDRHRRGHLPDGVASESPFCLSKLSRDRLQGVNPDLVRWSSACPPALLPAYSSNRPRCCSATP